MLNAHAGPFLGFGQSAPAGAGQGQVPDNNPSRSPSVWDQGCGIMDPRPPYAYPPGASSGGTLIGERGAYMWWGASPIMVLSQVPSTASTTSIAAAQVPVAGTALTLVSASGGGITVGVSLTRADTGVLVTGLLAIDLAQAPIQNGATGGNIIWSPTTALARAVQINSVGNDSAATMTVRGFDVYGFPMTEAIAMANVGTVTGKKAFKDIQSMTPSGTLSGSNVSAGQSDTIGLMLRADLFQYVTLWWPDQTLIASPAGFTAADTTSPVTATTGDVRATYALQGVGSNGTRRLVAYVNLPPVNIGTAAGLVGVPHYADF